VAHREAAGAQPAEPCATYLNTAALPPYFIHSSSASRFTAGAPALPGGYDALVQFRMALAPKLTVVWR
jgi:hypothetical protein